MATSSKRKPRSAEMQAMVASIPMSAGWTTCAAARAYAAERVAEALAKERAEWLTGLLGTFETQVLNAAASSGLRRKLKQARGGER